MTTPQPHVFLSVFRSIFQFVFQVVFLTPLFYFVLLASPVTLAGFLYAQSDSKLTFRKYLEFDFPLRHAGIHLNFLWQNNTLKKPDLGNVHFGKDNWLYLLTESDGNSRNDVNGMGSPSIVEKWTSLLEKNIKSAYDFNCPYLFVFVPNKERVYPENLNLHMQSQREDLSNFTMLKNALPMIFPKHVLFVDDLLKNAKKMAPTFFKKDSHWNFWGSFVASQKIVELAYGHLNAKLQSEPPGSPEPVSANKNDLEVMLDSRQIKALSLPSVYDPDFRFAQASLPITRISLYPDKPWLEIFAYPEKKFTVWVIGDSFMFALMDHLPRYFGTVFFMHWQALSDSSLSDFARKYGKPDLIIEEQIERHLDIRNGVKIKN